MRSHPSKSTSSLRTTDQPGFNWNHTAQCQLAWGSQSVLFQQSLFPQVFPFSSPVEKNKILNMSLHHISYLPSHFCFILFELLHLNKSDFLTYFRKCVKNEQIRMLDAWVLVLKKKIACFTKKSYQENIRYFSLKRNESYLPHIIHSQTKQATVVFINPSELSQTCIKSGFLCGKNFFQLSPRRE